MKLVLVLVLVGKTECKCVCIVITTCLTCFNMLPPGYVFHCSVRSQSHSHLICRKNDWNGDDRGGLCLNSCNDVVLDLDQKDVRLFIITCIICLTTKLFRNSCNQYLYFFVKILQWSLAFGIYLSSLNWRDDGPEQIASQYACIACCLLFY